MLTVSIMHLGLSYWNLIIVDNILLFVSIMHLGLSYWNPNEFDV